ncbi:DNA-processing protein DprA [Clostridioides sp. GD02377]|uniref:DNA-processing protein DprA n=1 Tax=unclassified Clostridioides TaxID=2635829 RepID=UPI00143144D0|nr:DNA-processing protein DprA [Clostridioides difficile]NJJ36149.1 DNA-protecting protein DprA [Clostridioides difficile]NJK15350.1 DNA-protecting protein DprA [Clostridioides difficile]
MEKRDIYLWLKSISGITTKTIEIIENEVVNIEDIFDFSEKEIYNLKNISLNIRKNIVKYRGHAYLENIKELLYKKTIKYICQYDKEYPEKLKNIYNAPKLLFYKGDIGLVNDNFNIAMVGSRKPTAYGISCAKTISCQLSQYGVNIVSGLAIGIDAYSHIGCMNGKSKTIAVLGSGVDNPLPKQNLYLSNKILENGGLLLSEYNINSTVAPYHFSNRNRIISGLSDGVVVVEAAMRSGALITVDFALEHGKNVFAIPGNINSQMSRGCHKIIKEGAKLIENIDDILNEYNIFNIIDKKINQKYDNISLNAKSKQIIEAIKREGNLHIDSICDYTGIEIKYVNSIINELVLNELVVEMNNKTYSLNV